MSSSVARCCLVNAVLLMSQADGRRDIPDLGELGFDEFDGLLTPLSTVEAAAPGPVPCNSSGCNSFPLVTAAQSHDISMHSSPSSATVASAGEPPAVPFHLHRKTSPPSAISLTFYSAVSYRLYALSAFISNVSLALAPPGLGAHGNLSEQWFYGDIPPSSNFSPPGMSEIPLSVAARVDTSQDMAVESEGFASIVDVSGAFVFAPMQAELGAIVSIVGEDVPSSVRSLAEANATMQNTANGSNTSLLAANSSAALVSAPEDLALHPVPGKDVVNANSTRLLTDQAVLQNVIDGESGPDSVDNASQRLLHSPLPQAPIPGTHATGGILRAPAAALEELTPFWEGAETSAKELEPHMDSLLSGHWRPDGTVFSESAMQRPPSSKPRVCLAVFMAVYAYAAVCFWNKGSQYAGQVGDEQEKEAGKGLRPRRSFAFHGPIAFAAASLAIAKSLELLECPCVVWSVPWCYCGRAVAGTLLVMTLGHASGAADEEVCPAATLTAAAWAQLGLAAAAKEPTLHWGLSLSGFMCGAVALHGMNTMARRRTWQTCGVSAADMQRAQRGRMELIGDLVTFCCILRSCLWLATEGAHLLSETCAIVFNSMLDMLLVVGCGHLLLKKAEFLDMGRDQSSRQ